MRRSVNQALIKLTGYQLTRADAIVASNERDRTPESASPWRRTYGCVDKISRRVATGWVVGPANEFPVQVALYLDDVKVRTVWTDQPTTANTVDAAYSFRIPLRGIWDYCSPVTRVNVRLDGVPLPVAGKGIFKRTGTTGQSDLDELQRLLESGYVFNDYGDLQLSKKLDHAWQAQVIDMYRRVGDVVRDKHGHEIFVVYGTLLGQVRERGFIAHDDDFDAAYVSRATSGSAAAAELRDIGLSLVDAGFDVDPRRTALHIHDSDDPRLRIDLFHLFFDEVGRLQMPFGRAGRTDLTVEAWQGTELAALGEHSTLR